MDHHGRTLEAKLIFIEREPPSYRIYFLQPTRFCRHTCLPVSPLAHLSPLPARRADKTWHCVLSYVMRRGLEDARGKKEEGGKRKKEKRTTMVLLTTNCKATSSEWIGVEVLKVRTKSPMSANLAHRQ